MLHRDGHLEHEGEPIRHERLRRLLERSVRFSPADAAFVVQVGRYRGGIEIEGTPFFVRLYDADTGMVHLSDRSIEPLQPETLRIGADDVFTCRVKRSFDARFTHAGQSSLLEAVSWDDATLWLRVGDRRVSLSIDPGT